MSTDQTQGGKQRGYLSALRKHRVQLLDLVLAGSVKEPLKSIKESIKGNQGDHLIKLEALHLVGLNATNLNRFVKLPLFCICTFPSAADSHSYVAADGFWQV